MAVDKIVAWIAVVLTAKATHASLESLLHRNLHQVPPIPDDREPQLTVDDDSSCDIVDAQSFQGRRQEGRHVAQRHPGRGLDLEVVLLPFHVDLDGASALRRLRRGVAVSVADVDAERVAAALVSQEVPATAAEAEQGTVEGAVMSSPPDRARPARAFKSRRRCLDLAVFLFDTSWELQRRPLARRGAVVHVGQRKRLVAPIPRAFEDARRPKSILTAPGHSTEPSSLQVA
uniref:Putative secreted protein n=1 Tax=Ixodes ricinus TaxID=34613 RepID=A0A6B0V457_IXORI